MSDEQKNPDAEEQIGDVLHGANAPEESEHHTAEQVAEERKLQENQTNVEKKDQ